MGGAENCWVRPELVAQVKFANWTDDGRLRAPVFRGLRLDVDPKNVTREAEETVVVPAATLPVRPPRSEATDASQLLERLSGSEDAIRLDVEGYRISLTNLNKALWPEDKGSPAKTKRDMIRYYLSMGSVLLPHLKDRPMTLTRYPNGIDGEASIRSIRSMPLISWRSCLYSRLTTRATANTSWWITSLP